MSYRLIVFTPSPCLYFKIFWALMLIWSIYFIMWKLFIYIIIFYQPVVPYLHCFTGGWLLWKCSGPFNATIIMHCHSLELFYAILCNLHLILYSLPRKWLRLDYKKLKSFGYNYNICQHIIFYRLRKIKLSRKPVLVNKKIYTSMRIR